MVWGQDVKSSTQLGEMVIYYKFNIRLIRINKLNNYHKDETQVIWCQI
jgi:hypothetical protein